MMQWTLFNLRTFFCSKHVLVLRKSTTEHKLPTDSVTTQTPRSNYLP